MTPMKPHIIIIKNNLVESATPSTSETCEKDFLAAVASNVSNWDEYTQEDKDIIVEQGYETSGNGSVCLTWI